MTIKRIYSNAKRIAETFAKNKGLKFSEFSDHQYFSVSGNYVSLEFDVDECEVWFNTYATAVSINTLKDEIKTLEKLNSQLEQKMSQIMKIQLQS